MHHHPIHSQDPSPATTLVKDRYVWIMLVVWFVLAAPLFIGMPLNSDTALYDVQARMVLDGGTAYRDIIEPNLPGALWVHLVIRSVAGWSSEAMKAVDLLILGAVLWVWSRVYRRDHHSMPLFLLIGAFFYLTRNEWCHAQRDAWMLLPTGLAVTLRLSRSSGSRILPAVAEGICWGCAFWIKPHVAVPVIAVVLVDLRIRSLPAAVRDTTAVIAGGILVAIPGIIWLFATGTWEHFWHMMLEWNPEYVAAARSRMSLERWIMMSHRFAPWLWIHVIAVPLAVTAVVRFWKTDHIAFSRRQALLAACYLGWLVQSVTLQHALDYIHVPAIILGLAIVCGHSWQMPIALRRPIVAAFVLFGILWTPFFRGQRLQQWPVVITRGSTVDVRPILAHGNFPNWRHLAQVIDFLNKQEVADGDVTCLNVHSVHVYNETQTHPSTRYWSVSILQDLFPQRSADIVAAVNKSHHRYVVMEMVEERLIHPDSRQPWRHEMTTVFESGSYRILAIGPDRS